MGERCARQGCEHDRGEHTSRNSSRCWGYNYNFTAMARETIACTCHAFVPCAEQAVRCGERAFDDTAQCRRNAGHDGLHKFWPIDMPYTPKPNPQPAALEAARCPKCKRGRVYVTEHRHCEMGRCDWRREDYAKLDMQPKPPPAVAASEHAARLREIADKGDYIDRELSDAADELDRLTRRVAELEGKS